MNAGYSSQRRRALSAAVAAAALWAATAQAQINLVGPENGGRNGPIHEVEFKDASVQNAIRVISELTGTNIIATNTAGAQTFNLFLRDVTVSDAIDSIARVAGLWYRRNPDTGVYMVMTTEEYFKDIIVFREEKTRMFTLRFQNVVRVASTVQAMFGSERVELDLQGGEQEATVPGGELSNDILDATSSPGSSSSRGSRRSTASGTTRSRAAVSAVRDGETQLEMGVGQIALLERAQALQGEDPLQVSERTLAAVRKQSQVPIFVSINREHNLLYVRTADERALQEIERIVKESDRPTPQVLLEMKVLSIQLDDAAQSAFDLNVTGGAQTSGPTDGQAPNPLSPSAATGSTTTLGLVNAGLQDASSAVFQLLNDRVRLRMQLLQREGRVNVLSTPMLLASNNRPAKIFIGEETVLTTGFTASTASGGNNNTFITTPVPATETREIGNTLTILPSINADRTVLMRLLQESSRVNAGGAQIPVVANGSVVNVSVDTVDTSTMEGTVMASDGLTVVVGGMITESDSDNERKVPVLGDLPLLGNLFKDTQRSNGKQELVLLITPHVFTTPEEAEAISRARLHDLAKGASSEVDIYLDRLTETRPQARAQVPAPHIDEAQLYAELTRFAAAALRDPAGGQRLRPMAERLRLEAPAALHMLPDAEVVAEPVASWRDGRYYVSVVDLRNRSRQHKTLHESQLLGDWLAATLERPQLGGQAGIRAFLISEQPFEVATRMLQSAAADAPAAHDIWNGILPSDY